MRMNQKKENWCSRKTGKVSFLTVVWQCHCFQSHTVSDVRWKLLHKEDIFMSEKYKVIVE